MTLHVDLAHHSHGITGLVARAEDLQETRVQADVYFPLVVHCQSTDGLFLPVGGGVLWRGG